LNPFLSATLSFCSISVLHDHIRSQIGRSLRLFSSGLGTDSATQLEEDCKPIKVEDGDGRDFVKLERVDDVVPTVEDEAEKIYRMLDVTKAGLSNNRQFYSHEEM
jgi:hypothetical protein